MIKFIKPILIMGFLTLFTSCTSDDNKDSKKDPKNTELIVPTSMSILYPKNGDVANHYTFEYIDENSTIISKVNITFFNSKTESITHIYDEGKLVEFQSLYEGKSSTTNINYDNDNRITSIKGNSSYFLKYNKIGLITSIIPSQENNDVYYSFSYNGAKSITKSEILDRGKSTGTFTTFEYDNKNTPFKNANVKMDLMNQYDILSTTMFNQENNHNINKITHNYSQGDITSFTYDYTYNTNEYPTKVIKTLVGTGVESIITYEYKTITITE